MNPLFTGNGMPDVAELGLLNGVLKDTEIDFAARSGVVNQFAREAWAANLGVTFTWRLRCGLPQGSRARASPVRRVQPTAVLLAMADGFPVRPK